jgi:hypothetical protein
MLEPFYLVLSIYATYVVGITRYTKVVYHREKNSRA